jgi:hypothetical protein
VRYARHMTDDPQDFKVENVLLRSSLYLIARALKDYHEAWHVKVDQDGRPMLQVTVPESLREKATEVLAKAQQLLRDNGQERG